MKIAKILTLKSFAGNGNWTRAKLVTGSNADHYARLVVLKPVIVVTILLVLKKKWENGRKWRHNDKLVVTGTSPCADDAINNQVTWESSWQRCN